MKEISRLSLEVGRRLKQTRMVLATAESCTGGWISQAVTSVSGSSGWFERGFVTYSDDAKRELLGVSRSTLNKHGAVSEETAREMARGALERSRAGVAVAVTGIAGPTGGSDAKPVGTVCFAWARRGGDVIAETRRFMGDRESVRAQSVVRALQGVLELLTSAQAGHT